MPNDKPTTKTPIVNYDTLIYNEVINQGLSNTLALFIVSQARHETNNYTSNVFKTLNNAFGYKYVGQKKWVSGPGTNAPAKDAQGNNDGGTYAKYPTVNNSVGELCDWLKRRQNGGEKLDKIVNLTQYANMLKKYGYYGQTSQEYALAMSSTFKKIQLV